MTPLTVDKVAKIHGNLQTVFDVSLKIEPGERVALLGHNGAGKTTLMKMVLGLTSISGGSIEVLGAKPGSHIARKSVSFLPESVAFHGALSGREQLHHFARLKSISLRIADDWLERVGLADAADRKIRTYSKGMRQRVGLAQVMLGTPKLALLDEPTGGLDPISRQEFYQIVDELAQAGTAILLSSHALTELETRMDRVAIMSKGVLVADDSLSNLRQKARLPIRVKVTGTSDVAGSLAQGYDGRRVNGHSVELACQQNEKMAMLSHITSLGAAVTDVDMTPANLEELYSHFSNANRELN